MDFRKIANFFCDMLYESLDSDDIKFLIKKMILTKNFNYDEINWCFPLYTKKFYHKILYDIIAQYKNKGYSDQSIIEVLNIPKEDFKEAISYLTRRDDTNE